MVEIGGSSCIGHANGLLSLGERHSTGRQEPHDVRKGALCLHLSLEASPRQAGKPV
jgi:hypothetical protein